jgi:peptide/nickel transport system substrate-binding protein
MYVRMQDLMEEGGCYVFLTHEATGVAYRNTIKPAIAPNGTPIFHAFTSA